MGSLLTEIRERAEQTPADRNRYVDLLRVLAIGMVVVGHWLAVAFTTRQGRLDGLNVLTVLDWAHWATWLFQVMPIFFLVGGFANAASWSSHRRRGGDWASWVHRRAVRLLWPTTLFVAFGVAGVLVARLVGVERALLDDAAWFVAIMLWFLAIYVGVVALAPLTLAAHRRWGLGVPLAMGIGVVATDVARLGLDTEWISNVNYLLVWAGIHQLGYWWRDARLGQQATWAMAGGGAVGLILRTTVGPYPISMISIPGAEIQNTSPPSVGLAALAVAQAGFLLLIRGPAQRWLSRRRVWAVVVGANSVVMTLFLWHMVPVLAVAPLLHLTGLFPDPPIGSAGWLALRPVWVSVVAIAFLPIVALLGRWERPPRALELSEGSGRSVEAGVLTALGIGAVSAGIALLTILGFFHQAGPVGLPVGGLSAYVVGLALIEWGGRRAELPAPR